MSKNFLHHEWYHYRGQVRINNYPRRLVHFMTPQQLFANELNAIA